MSAQEPQARVCELLRSLLDNYDPSYGLGSMTCSVYDTAWVACVSKIISGRRQWLFPSSFSYIINSQLPNGGWPAHAGEDDTDEVDGILSTMAGLYCLTQHAKNPLQLRGIESGDLAMGIEKGIARSAQLLEELRVGDCKSVGFEILVPSLLELLSKEGVQYRFPDQELLLQVRNQKLAKVRPEILYTEAPSALLHSLEAFHGREDFSFDQIAHQKVGGSMMASPSATASYLIRCTHWDDEAESYLRLVISNGEGKSSGGVPSAYPSTNFELTWVVSTMLETGLWAQGAHEFPREKVLNILGDARESAGGLVGFAPGIEPDLDDSAKSSIIFSLLGRPGFTARIVEHFDSSTCLKTYMAERTSSVSANCNALLSIVLDSEEYQSKSPTIEKVTAFVCKSWWDTDGSLDDKWNLSGYYPAMLMAQSFTELLQAWNAGRFSQLSHLLLRENVMPTLFQCLIRILQSQSLDGSWGQKGPREETAYAVLTLLSLLVLPLAQFFRTEILSAIGRGRSFLRTSVHKPEYIWIEKVTYGSVNLAKAYNVAALHASVNRQPLGQGVTELCSMHFKDVANFRSLIDEGPLSKHSRWLVLASWIDSRLCVPQLQKSLGDSDRQPGFEECCEMTAFLWMFANHRMGLALSPRFLCGMISVSLLQDRLVAMMDDVAVLLNRNEIEQLTDAISNTVGKADHSYISRELDGERVHTHEDKKSKQLSMAEDTLSSFQGFFYNHYSLSGATKYDRATLLCEVRRFLQAQIMRIGERTNTGEPRSVHYDMNLQRWAHGDFPMVSTSLTGWPLMFAFAMCLRVHNGRELCPTPLQKRVIEDVGNCSATVFQLKQSLLQSNNSPSVSELGRSRSQMAELLSYEKSRLTLAMGHLGKTGLREDALKTIEVVVDIADLAGEASQMRLW